jgi:hypothetical protein
MEKTNLCNIWNKNYNFDKASLLVQYIKRENADHVLAEYDDEGEDLEENGGRDGRQPGLLAHQVRVHFRLCPVVESQLPTEQSL